MMRQITATYFVSPQIEVDDLPTIAAAGIKTVICNRPDEEVPPSHQAAALKAAVEAAGLKFVLMPVTHTTMTSDLVAAQHAAIADNEGPVLAYCASGTRSSIVWALGVVGEMSVDDILAATQAAGYDLGGMRPTLEAMAR
jgi:uncharacterized protein (TIGR01244 family)